MEQEKLYGKRPVVFCSECGSEYYGDTSKMTSLCPQCASVLYGYKNCAHDFENGRCVKCYWDGSVSDYLKECNGDINEIERN